MKMETVLMRSNLQVQQRRAEPMKEQDCHHVRGLALLSFPIMNRRMGLSVLLQILSLHCSLLLVIRTSKQELFLAATSVCSGGAFQCVIHILFYVQLYINVNSLQRVTRIHNHYSQNDKIVKLGLPQP